jgi:signal transduction histidine kinase
VPIRGENGEVVGIAGITRDVTQLKTAEENIQRLNEDLERRVIDRTAKLAAANRLLEAEIGERREAERKIRTYQERLRSLASEISLAEERERRHIAVGLHDQVAQTLALIQIKLQEMRKTVPDGALARELDECVELIHQPIHDTRTLMFNLSPPVLYAFGLKAAAAWLVEQQHGRNGLSVTFEDDEQPKPLDQTVSVLLFRAIRELLTNVVKHSHAQNACVWLEVDGSTLRAGVEDDGRGFDTASLGGDGDSLSGFGLFSIREQLERVGGTMRIATTGGAGSRIILTVPLQHEVAAAPVQGDVR